MGLRVFKKIKVKFPNGGNLSKYVIVHYHVGLHYMFIEKIFTVLYKKFKRAVNTYNILKEKIKHKNSYMQ